MKKIKCKVCGTRFAGSKDALYLATENMAVIPALTMPAKAFECFDCPKCGCQNAVNIRMAPVMETDEEDNDDE